jgi:MraZ protein
MSNSDKPLDKKNKFVGAFYHALEQKGRLAIPAQFRKQMGKRAVLTRGLDGCLFMFDEVVFEKVIADINKQSILRKDVREWMRILAHNASEVEFDSQGRILVSQHLRSLAQLEGECVIAGMIDRVEIWQRDRYETYMENLDKRAEEVAEKLANLENREQG